MASHTDSFNLTVPATARDNELGDANEIALALSGGGFRATLFHVGSLLRLNELGFLPRIRRVVSVSGGSIAAALLGLRWHELRFDNRGVALNLENRVVDPLREFCGRNVDVPTIIKALVTPWRLRRPGNLLARPYAQHLFGLATLQDLPDTPDFSFLAAELHSAVTFIFNKRRIGCYTVGWSDRAATIRIADCVAASSSFPPHFLAIQAPTLRTPIERLPPRFSRGRHRLPYGRWNHRQYGLGYLVEIA